MAGVWDSHIHMYPPEVFADPVAWGRAHDEPWWTACVAPSEGRSLQGWADIARLLRDMDRAGVEKCVMLGWYWEHQETCDIQAGWFADWIRQHPDRLMAFAPVQPAAGQKAIEGLLRALDAGLSGIGEMLPQAQGFSFADENWARVVEIAVERDVPINLHVTSPLSASYAATLETPLDDYLRLVQRFPEATFILAHFGGGIPFYELKPRVRELFRNCYYDTAASPLIYDPRIFRTVIDTIGADRVLFGTDYPLLCYPGDMSEPDFERQRADAVRMLTAEEEAKVMGGNLRRLLKLEAG